ncbi:hypothetical protein NC99_27430 [Sunxiuqinia dokdonensis]|uniref:Uncharacterized protein n=1 Tax=Sunxiuqinia dokdonensis TaxID=1409788 RepID=A0A0L8V829_9BACT|nr:hypothetical protein NC99_27430 [Sunxiuqinia dokdonensis]
MPFTPEPSRQTSRRPIDPSKNSQAPDSSSMQMNYNPDKFIFVLK